MLAEYGIIGILFLGGIFFATAAMVMSRIFQPRKQYPLKQETYECGLETEGSAWVRFKVSYFLYALVFLVFDVETLFLYPWAVQFNQLGLFAIVEMCIFFVILIVGFVFAWKEGAFKWY